MTPLYLLVAQATERTPLTSETDGAASSLLPWRTSSSADPQFGFQKNLLEKLKF